MQTLTATQPPYQFMTPQQKEVHYLNDIETKNTALATYLNECNTRLPLSVRDMNTALLVMSNFESQLLNMHPLAVALQQQGSKNNILCY